MTDTTLYSAVQWFDLSDRLSKADPNDQTLLETLAQEIDGGIRYSSFAEHNLVLLPAPHTFTRSFDQIKILHRLVLPNYVLTRATDWPGAPSPAFIEMIKVDPELRHATGYPVIRQARSLELAYASCLCACLSGQ